MKNKNSYKRGRRAFIQRISLFSLVKNENDEKKVKY
jgi:hypothetical protein